MNAVQQAKSRVQDRIGQDYYVNLVNSHPGHIARSKAKAARYHELCQFRAKHPILWKLGARPRQKKGAA